MVKSFFEELKTNRCLLINNLYIFKNVALLTFCGFLLVCISVVFDIFSTG